MAFKTISLELPGLPLFFCDKAGSIKHYKTKRVETG
jgi:hypothetical protein